MRRSLLMPLLRGSRSASLPVVYSDEATALFGFGAPPTVNGGRIKITNVSGTIDGIHTSIERKILVEYPFNDDFTLVYEWIYHDFEGFQLGGTGANWIASKGSQYLVPIGQPIDYKPLSAGYPLNAISSDEDPTAPMSMQMDDGTVYYAGGGHGHPGVYLGFAFPSGAHGLTYNHIGERFTDSDGDVWILKQVPSEYSLVFVSENVSPTAASGGIQAKAGAAMAGPLTHITGGTPLPAISGWIMKQDAETKGDVDQTGPPNFIRNGVVLDVTVNQEYAGFDSFIITQTSRYRNPHTVGDYIVEERPWTTWPNPEEADTVFTTTQVYSFREKGKCTIYHNHTQTQSRRLQRATGIQHSWNGGVNGSLNGLPAISSVLRRIPALTPVTDSDGPKDYREGIDIRTNGYKSSLLLTNANSQDGRPINRFFDTIEAEIGGASVTLVNNLVRLPIHNSTDDAITAQGGVSFWLFPTQKAYPTFYEKPDAPTVGPGFSLTTVWEYSWDELPADGSLNAVEVEVVGDSTYIFRDYDTAAAYELVIPDGRTFTLDRKSDNVSLSGNVGTITVTVTSAIPMVAFLEGHIDPPEDIAMLNAPLPYREVTGPDTIGPNDRYIIATSGTFTLTLATVPAGKPFEIYNSGDGVITVVAAGTISGAASATINPSLTAQLVSAGGGNYILLNQ